MQTILFIPTQGPHLSRAGPREQFDWRVQCRKAAEMQKATPGSLIFVPSAFQQTGSRAEIDFYGEQLRAEGVPEKALLLSKRGFDTVEQCELALALLNQEQARLIAISCHVQSRRVRSLLKGHAVEHVVVHGIPSRWLQFTNCVLGFGFPVLDWLGLREWWKRRVARRRLQGKQ